MCTKYLISVIALIGSLGLFGCATTDTITKEPFREIPRTEILENKALIYIYRPSRYGSSANTFKISVNGKHVTDMGNGGYFPYLATPGSVQITSEPIASILNIGLALGMMGESELTLDAEAGESYFINVKIKFSGGPELVLVDTEEGLKGIRDTKKTKPVQLHE